ncbi:hypothetical protein G6F42_020452 [Rhizopus arrhizus]|nr:hypothetical protein G6F42_020452 [Rhizopus arrhizus]
MVLYVQNYWIPSTKPLARQRLESTAASETVAAVEKKSGSILGKLVGLTFVLGSAYGGATYYALQDPKFRQQFVEYMPGAEETLKFVQDLQKNENFTKGTTEGWKQQLDECLPHLDWTKGATQVTFQQDQCS